MRFLKKFEKNIYSILVLTFIFILAFYFYYSKTSLVIQGLRSEKNNYSQKLKSKESELKKITSEDQYIKNKNLEEEINNIVKSYSKSVSVYENMLKFRNNNKKQIPEYEKLYAQTLTLLSQRNYASAQANLTIIDWDLQKETAKIAQSFTIPANVVSDNKPPSAGYKRQLVKSDIGDFMVDIISADLSSTKIIVDTASESSCTDNCPVLSLSDYVSRNGAFAGVNGSYFCPSDYPSCSGKTNSFDTLLMNKNKVYFNSDNNVYSTVPAVIFGGGWIRFVGRSLDWGRDTGIDSMIANQGLLLSAGNIAFGGDGDPKKGSKGSRSFVGANGNTVYIGTVHNATVAEVAHALKALDLTDALNLDSGGSTALWYSGYKVGPGRNLPNVILFVRK